MMQKAFVWKVIVGALPLIILLGGYAGIAVSQEPIKVGMMYDLSGPNASYSPDYMAGHQFAIDEQNEKGGIKGRQIKHIFADDGCDSAKSVSIATRFIEEEKVCAILGSIASTVCIATTMQMNKLGKYVPVIGGGMSDRLYEPDLIPWYFGICGSNKWLTRSMVKELNDKGYKKIGIIYNTYAWGISMKDATVKNSEEYKLKVVRIEPVDLGVADLTMPLNRLRDAGAEAIAVGMADPKCVLALLRARADLKWQVPVTGPDIIWSREIVAYPKLAEGILGAAYANYEGKRMKEFVKRFKAKYGKELASPDIAAACYDGTKILIAAMLKAKNPADPKELRDLILNDTKDFPLVAGLADRVTMDSTPDGHQIIRMRPVYKVMEGKKVFGEAGR
jgi:branched-chain amino acid transport system substrate-binding protein